MKVNGPNLTQQAHLATRTAARKDVDNQGPAEAFAGSVEEAGFEKPSVGTHFNATNPQLREHGGDLSINAAGIGGLPASVAVARSEHPQGPRWDIRELAIGTARMYDLQTEFPKAVEREVADMLAKTRPSPGVYVLPPDAHKPWVRDLRHIDFVSVDNGTRWDKMDPDELVRNPEANVSSKDIDQLQWVEKQDNGDIKVMVAVSDVDAFVKKGSAHDRFMDENTASLYAPSVVFNLSHPVVAEDLASLNPREERLSTIIEYTVTPEGEITNEDVYQGIVKSRTKLDYASVGGWLEGDVGPSPAIETQGDWLKENLRDQMEASRRIEAARDEAGAIEFEGTEWNIKVEDGVAVSWEKSQKNVATEMVENFMVTSNSVVSRFLRDRGYPTLERVVVTPEKWPEIRDVAKEFGVNLPRDPDGKALSKFLVEQNKKNPEGAKDLSVRVIRLIGRGEYEGVGPEDELPGHFPLGVKNYSQVTASIRRGGDRKIGRQIKAALAGEPPAYGADDYGAERLNEMGRVIPKFERMINKQVIGTMLEDRIGEVFEAKVTGVKPPKVWVGVKDTPIEGSLFKAGGRQWKEGDTLRVKLTKVNVQKGWIDFEPVRGD